jgi:hypothetical protein
VNVSERTFQWQFGQSLQVRARIAKRAGRPCYL